MTLEELAAQLAAMRLEMTELHREVAEARVLAAGADGLGRVGAALREQDNELIIIRSALREHGGLLRNISATLAEVLRRGVPADGVPADSGHEPGQ